MRLASILALLLAFGIGSSVSAATPSPDKASKDYISRIRIGGWIGDDALLVMPDRRANSCKIGASLSGAKLVEIGDNSFTTQYSGTQVKVTLDPGLQLAPHPDLTNWLTADMKDVGHRIDAQVPDVTNEGVVHFTQNGAAASTFMKVQNANPYSALPDWMESIDLKVSINPHDPTRVSFMGMTITQQAYDRLCKSMYKP